MNTAIKSVSYGYITAHKTPYKYFLVIDGVEIDCSEINQIEQESTKLLKFFDLLHGTIETYGMDFGDFEKDKSGYVKDTSNDSVKNYYNYDSKPIIIDSLTDSYIDSTGYVYKPGSFDYNKNTKMYRFSKSIKKGLRSKNITIHFKRNGYQFNNSDNRTNIIKKV